MTRIEDHWCRRDAAWIELNTLKRELVELDLRRASEAVKDRLEDVLSEACSIYNFECAAIGAIYDERHRPANRASTHEL